MRQNTKLILKSVALLYTNYKEAEKGIRETTPFIKATNNITLTKQMNDLYDNNFTSLKNEEDIRKWKYLSCSWIGRTNNKNDHLTKNNLQIQ